MKEEYKVAGHRFSVSMSSNDPLWSNHQAYEPFRVDGSQKDSTLFNLTLCEGLEHGDASAVHIDQSGDDVAVKVDLWEDKLSYILDIRDPRSDMIFARVAIPHNNKECAVTLMGSDQQRRAGLDNAIILCFMFFTLPLRTLFIHASSVLYRGKAYLFIAKSGTGKSTHSKMWMRTLSDVELLNDDHPIIRVQSSGEVIAYGSPWSGKTPCYKDLSAPLGAVVRITRAPENRLHRLSTFESYGSLMTSCAGINYLSRLADLKSETLGDIIGSVPCFRMECRADSEAAEVCANGVVG